MIFFLFTFWNGGEEGEQILCASQRGTHTHTQHARPRRHGRRRQEVGGYTDRARQIYKVLAAILLRALLKGDKAIGGTCCVWWETRNPTDSLVESRQRLSGCLSNRKCLQTFGWLSGVSPVRCRYTGKTLILFIYFYLFLFFFGMGGRSVSFIVEGNIPQDEVRRKQSRKHFMTFTYCFMIEEGESFQAVLFLPLFYSMKTQNFEKRKKKINSKEQEQLIKRQKDKSFKDVSFWFSSFILDLFILFPFSISLRCFFPIGFPLNCHISKFL